MLSYLKQQANRTVTENGAAAYATTGSDCLDLFATVGALRHATEGEITQRFVRAYTEDPDAAMKLLFFARDVRGGLGERRVFRTALQWLAWNKPDSVQKNIPYIAGYGRYDDLLVLLDTPCQSDALHYLHTCFQEDLARLKRGEAVSLLAKWLPSVNASNVQTVRHAKAVARAFGMTDAHYRKALTALRRNIRLIENNLRERDYTFAYEKQPFRALLKYRKALGRNDGERYNAFLTRVQEGAAVLHAANISPYELVQPYLGDVWTRENPCFLRPLSAQEEKTLNATWEALPSFDSTENALAVVDTSGSMYWEKKPLPAAVALSLGLYFAQHNTGVFRGHFIEFSAHPQLIELKGDTFADRLRYAASFNQVANTNVDAVFDLVLETALLHGVPQHELPNRLVFISDMEFDACVENGVLPNFERAQKKYAAHGYTLPQVVFWNVASRHRSQPVRMNQSGVTLVSGATPRLFAQVACGGLTPFQWMMDTLQSERYAPIRA